VIKVKEVIRYQCDFCNKTYKNKSSARVHEKKCFANPATKSCRTCKHAIKDSDTIYVRPTHGENYGDSDFEQEFIYCNVIEDKYLSHYEKECGFETNCSEWELAEKNLF
jgi:hypothetical protein